MIKLLKTLFLYMIIMSFSAGVHFANQTNTSLSFSANVIGTCNVSTLPVVFAGYTGFSDVDAQGEVIVQCLDGLPYQVALDSGQHFSQSNSKNLRAMSDGAGNYLDYLLQKPDFSGEWGDAEFSNTYPSGTVVHGIGTGYDINLTVNGRLLGIGQPASPGYYTDIVTVHVHF